MPALFDILLFAASAVLGAGYPAVLKQAWTGYRGDPLALTGLRLVLAAAGAGANFSLLLLLLARHPVAVAFPVVTGLTIVVAAFLGARAFAEPLAPGRLAGSALVIAGVALVYAGR